MGVYPIRNIYIYNIYKCIDTYLYGKGAKGIREPDAHAYIYIYIQETERVRRASESRMLTLVRTVREAEDLQTQV